jgi:subtilisin family serine protease
MRTFPPFRHLASLGLLVGLAACEPITDVPTEGDAVFSVVGQDAQLVNGSFIILAEDSSLPSSLSDDVAARGGAVVGTLPQIGVAFVTSDDPDFIANMSGADGIKAVIPDLLMEFDHPTPDDELLDHGSRPGAGFFDNLTWGIHAVGAPAAWAAGNRGAGVRVAVLDAGIDAGHPDLAPNINAELSRSFFPCILGNCDGDVEDWRITPGFYFNHGTHVAGTIAATGDLGVTGVAPDAELVVIKVCTEFADACFTSSMVEGLVYAADVGADLANMSIGGLRYMRNDFVPWCRSEGYPASVCGRMARYYVTGQDDYVANTILVFKRAFQYAREGGTTVIVAAGNNGMDADRSKDVKLAFADFPHTIAVSALGPVGWCLDPSTNLDGPAYYTNTGRSVIDVAAPGGNWYGLFLGSPYTDLCTLGGFTLPAFVFDGVLSTVAGGWGWQEGTSMAAPHATGVAALLVNAHGGSMSPAQVERALKRAAEDLGSRGHDPIYGAGRVSAGY